VCGDKRRSSIASQRDASKEAWITPGIMAIEIEETRNRLFQSDGSPARSPPAPVQLGLTDDAVRLNALKMDDTQPSLSQLLGPGHEWVMIIGGSWIIGLQEMLM
jgi:hypothetical protein